MRAMAGCDPRTGEQLKLPHGRARVAAFDLTFSAPKSVSVLFAIADESVSAALLATASQLSRERRQGIALATRKAKEHRVDGIRWQDEARARAAEHGLGPAELSKLVTGQARQASRATAVDVADGIAKRLSGAKGLTGQHNTFAARHALAEIAGPFERGASMGEIRAAVDLYLRDGSVVPLGSVDHEARFTTRGLLACEEA